MPDASLASLNRGGLLVANRRFRQLVTAITISSAGDPISLTISQVVLFNATHSPVSLAGIFMIQIVSAILVGTLLGALTDRANRRQLIVRLEILRALVVASLPLLVLLSPFTIYPAMLVTGAIEAIVQPGRQAAIPELVGIERVASANSTALAAQSIGPVIGFAVAGVILTFFSDPRPFYLLDAATFLAAAALIAGIGDIGGGVRTASISRGLREALSIPAVRPFLAINAANTAATAVLLPAFLPLAYRLAPSNGPQAYTVLEVCLILGLLAGSLRAGRVPARYQLTAMVTALAVFALMHFAIGLSPNLTIAAISFGIGGVGNVVYTVMQRSGLMRAAESTNRGAVMSAGYSTVQVSRIFGYTFGAALVTALGPSQTFVLVGVWLSALTIAAAIWVRRAQSRT